MAVSDATVFLVARRTHEDGAAGECIGDYNSDSVRWTKIRHADGIS